MAPTLYIYIYLSLIVITADSECFNTLCPPKVIAYMTLGIDVSRLFSQMVMAIETKDLVVKKMVYLYLCNYAASNSELAIMCINTLQRDCSNEDPMVRGLALRSLCGLRIASAVEYMVSHWIRWCELLYELFQTVTGHVSFLRATNFYFLQIDPLRKGLEDSNSYVRKTAVIGMLSVFRHMLTTPYLLFSARIHGCIDNGSSVLVEEPPCPSWCLMHLYWWFLSQEC